jgi:hypothetical protein
VLFNDYPNPYASEQLKQRASTAKSETLLFAFAD